MAQAQAKAMVQNAQALGLTWTRRPATVSSDSPVMAIQDGDTTAIEMATLIGPVYVGQRVYVDIVPPSGNYIVGTAASTQLGARARVTNAQNVNSAAQTTAIWNVVDEESGADFLAVGGTVFTVPAAGLWAITFQPTMSGGGGTRNFGAINVTSTLTGAPSIYRASWDAGEDRTTVGVTIPMLAGDTFTASVFQNSGAPQTLAAWLGVYKVGGFVA
jgi:hypothetical protein